MSDKCPFCGAGIRENLHTLKTFTCNTKYSLFSEEWVYWQSIECKDHQIANLQASRDRWKELALAQKIIIAYEHRDADYGINAMIQAYTDRDNAIAALKAAGEWEDI